MLAAMEESLEVSKSEVIEEATIYPIQELEWNEN